MTIYITNQQKRIKIDSQKIEQLARSILLFLNRSKAELSILLVGDGEMKKLNREYRGISKTTDVLSFEASLPEFAPEFLSEVLGDVVINIFMAQKQAQSQKSDIYEEISRLLVHGILHLLGYDHEVSEEEHIAMTQKEEEIMNYVSRENSTLITSQIP